MSPGFSPIQKVLSVSVGAAAAVLLLTTAPTPALAELQTVPADQVTTMAKPLKAQKVNKERIWLLLVLGASSLFGATVLLENNEKWFPAISRANKAMAAYKQQKENAEARAELEQAQFDERLVEVQQEREEDARLESAVLAGLQEAKAAVGLATEAGAAEGGEFPAELDAPNDASSEGEDEDEGLPNYGDVDAELGQEEEADASHAAVAESAVGEDDGEAGSEGRRPLFEISAEQIDGSMQRQMLNQLSLEDLQRELEERKAAANGSGKSME